MAAIEACPEWLDWAVASHALNGAEHSGDIHVVMPHSRGVLLGVADGLGHGPEAAGAASAAAHVCKRYAERTVTELMMLCHEALRHTRGAVLSLASFRPATETIDWLGVGNVEGVLIRAPNIESSPDGQKVSLEQDRFAHESLRLHGGVIGYQIPRLHPSELKIRRGDVIILATIGLDSGFSRICPGTLGCQALADKILFKHERLSDDSLVLVARYLGAS